MLNKGFAASIYALLGIGCALHGGLDWMCLALGCAAGLLAGQWSKEKAE